MTKVKKKKYSYISKYEDEVYIENSKNIIPQYHPCLTHYIGK